MIKDTILNKILNAIHVIFFTSLLCFGITFLSGTILMIPAFTAAFVMGKTMIYKEFDITDSVIKNYFSYFKSAFCLMKYVPLNILLLLNVVGIVVAGVSKMEVYAIACLCIVALIITTLIYLAAYYAFFDKDLTLTEVVICMLYRPAFSIAIFVVVVLTIFFFSALILGILIFAGTLALFFIELVTFLHIMYYKKLRGMLEGEKYASLVLKEDRNKKTSN